MELEARAISLENGIAIVSQKRSEISYLTTYTAQGKTVHTLRYTKNIDGLPQFGNWLNKETLRFLAVIIPLVLLLIGIILSITINYDGCLLASFYVALYLHQDIYFLASVLYFKFTTIGHSHARFHAVEHMTIQFYDTYHRVPTIQELASTSRFSKSCGSMLELPTLMLNILIVLCFFSFDLLPNYLTLSLFLLVILFHLVACQHSWYQYCECLVTEKPTERELQLGIAALRFFITMEEYQTKSSQKGEDDK